MHFIREENTLKLATTVLCLCIERLFPLVDYVYTNVSTKVRTVNS